MNRREMGTTLAGGLLAGVAGGALPLAAHAQAAQAPTEGVQYVRLQQPAAVSAPAGKIEVVEFFWYGCPHCYAFDPMLEDWVKQLPSDVAFRRVPVAFTAVHAQHQKLFYTLEAMGKLDPALHRKIFNAIQQDHRRLDTEADQVKFLTENGIDGALYVKTSKEFHVQTKMNQAKQLSAAYKIDGVPALGIQGRYYTAGSLAGDHRRALQVADYLIQKVRKGG